MKSRPLGTLTLCLCAVMITARPALSQSCLPKMPPNEVTGHGGFEMVSIGQDNRIIVTYGDIEYTGKDGWFSHHAVQLYDIKSLDKLRGGPGLQQPFDVRQAADVDIKITGARFPTVSLSVNRSANETSGTAVDIDKVDDPTVTFSATCSADGIFRGAGVTASGTKTEYLLKIDLD